MSFHITKFTRELLYATILVLLLTACTPTAVPTTEVVVQPPISTPTLEPTFTPSPTPTDTPTPSPTATTEPTPTSIPQANLSGRILDQETGQPIAGAQVSAGSETVTTDEEGRYTLTNLSPGQYVLSATHDGYDPGLSAIFTVATGQEFEIDLTLYAPDTSPYPQDPMLTNPLDPNGAPTKEDAERLARLQGLTGKVVSIEETKLRGEFLVNYKIGDDIRAAVAELNHEVWELTDETGRQWWIIKVCGNLASQLPQEAPIATPVPRPLPPLAEVVVDGLVVRTCASEDCTEVGTTPRGSRVEVFGCLAHGGWCEVGWSGWRGWCTGLSLRRLAVAEAILTIEAVLPTPASEVLTIGEGRIAFISRSDSGNRNFEIYVINADGSGLTRLTNNSAWDDSPAWSPDGGQIIFHSDRDDLENCSQVGSTTCNWEIYVMNADGSNAKRLTNHPGSDKEPAWSPDGRQIAFVSDRDGAVNIYVMNADGTNVKRLTSHFQSDMGPAWSPDGHQIAFSSTTAGNSDIYLVNVDGTGLRRLIDYQTQDLSPAWSPDGHQIAFMSHSGSNYDDIYVINVDDSSSLIPLTTQPEGGYDPVWSPNGRKIAFRSYRENRPDIYVMNIDGSDRTPLTFEGNNYAPDWSRQ